MVFESLNRPLLPSCSTDRLKHEAVFFRKHRKSRTRSWKDSQDDLPRYTQEIKIISWDVLSSSYKSFNGAAKLVYTQEESVCTSRKVNVANAKVASRETILSPLSQGYGAKDSAVG